MSTGIATTVAEWWEWVRQDAVLWCAGKNWQWRVAVLLYAGGVAINGLLSPTSPNVAALPLFGLTLAVHELGHVLFQAFGQMLYVAGGSILQVTAPILLGISFLKQRDYFAISFAGSWLSFSLSNLAAYIADSRALKLPLVSLGGGGDAIHDWNYLLDQWGLLTNDLDIAYAVRLWAGMVALSAIGFGVWTLYRMIIGDGRPESNVVV